MSQRARFVIGLALVVALGAGVVAAFALSGGDGKSNAKVAARHAPLTTAVSVPAPLAATTPTTTPGPAPAATGDWNAIRRSINDYENLLFQRPDPAGVDLIVSQLCDCYAQEKQTITDMASKGHHWTGPAVRIDQVTFLAQPRPNFVDLRVVVAGLAGTVVDQQGAVVRSIPAIAPHSFRETLHLGPDGRWRITNQVLLPGGG